MRIILITIVCIIFTACYGENEENNIVVPTPFESNSSVLVNTNLQSNMVIQQNGEFSIYGQGTPGEKIRIHCGWEDENTFHIVDVNTSGNWQQIIEIPSASKTPYTIKVEGKYTKTFNNILIGDVWLCAGQSNMYFLLMDVINGDTEVFNANYPEIRLLNVTRQASDTLYDQIDAEWKICTSEIAGYFSAVGYFFGRKLLQEIDIPIGLIGSNWGNTGAEVWARRDLVMNNPELVEEATRKDAIPHTDGSPHKTGSAYNSMIYPLRNIPIKGIIWYQGENNQDKPYIYPALLETMVEGWRDDWKTDFPFYIAQICPFKRIWNYRTNYSNPAIRFMQSEASQQIENSGIEVNDDIADINNIHPKNKQDVGLRLAYLALGETYGMNEYQYIKCPIYDYYEISGNQIIIHFKHAESGFITTDSQAPTTFEVAGNDHEFHPATATISGSTIVLSSPSVEIPIAARMGWSYVKGTNLRAANGLPVSVFRTYNWEDEIEEQ